MSYEYIQYEYPTPNLFQKILFWTEYVSVLTSASYFRNRLFYIALKLEEDDDWTYYAGESDASGELGTGRTLTDYGTNETSAQTNAVKMEFTRFGRTYVDGESLPGSTKHLCILPYNFEAKYVRIYLKDTDTYSVTIYEFRPSTYISANEIVSGTMELTDELSDEPKLIVRANEIDRVEVGDLYNVGSNHIMGILGRDSDLATLFELSSSRNFISGWEMGGSALKAGKLESLNWSATRGMQIDLDDELILMGGRNVAGTHAGIFMGYDVVTEKYQLAAGDESAYFYYDGDDINLSNVDLKSNNLATSTGVEFDLANETIKFGGTGVNGPNPQAGMFLGKSNISGKYEFGIGNPATYLYFDGEDINLSNVDLKSNNLTTSTGVEFDLTNETIKFGGSQVVPAGTYSGAFLGKDSGTYKFFIGDPATSLIYASKTLTMKNVVAQSSNWTTNVGGQLDLSNETLKFGGSGVSPSDVTPQPGVFIGKESGLYKMFIGRTATFLRFDGYNMTLDNVLIRTYGLSTTVGLDLNVQAEQLRLGGTNVNSAGDYPGVYLGRHETNSNYVMYVGDGGNNYIQYDGNKLKIGGEGAETIKLVGRYFDGSEILFVNATEDSGFKIRSDGQDFSVYPINPGVSYANDMYLGTAENILTTASKCNSMYIWGRTLSLYASTLRIRSGTIGHTLYTYYNANGTSMCLSHSGDSSYNFHLTSMGNIYIESGNIGNKKVIIGNYNKLVVNTSASLNSIAPSTKLVSVTGSLQANRIITASISSSGDVTISPTNSFVTTSDSYIKSTNLLIQPSSGDGHLIIQPGGTQRVALDWYSSNTYLSYTGNCYFYNYNNSDSRMILDAAGNLTIDGKLTETGCLDATTISKRWDILGSIIPSFNTHNMESLPPKLKQSFTFPNRNKQKLDITKSGYRPSDVIHLLMNCVKDLKDNVSSLQEDIKKLKER